MLELSRQNIEQMEVIDSQRKSFGWVWVEMSIMSLLRIRGRTSRTDEANVLKCIGWRSEALTHKCHKWVR